MPPAKCPFLHRCNKYTDLTLRIDRLVESNAAKDRRIAALEAENATLKAAQTGSPSNPARFIWKMRQNSASEKSFRI